MEKGCDADADCAAEAGGALGRAKRALDSERDAERLTRVHDRYWAAT